MGLVNGDPRRMEVLECFASLDGKARQAGLGEARLGMARQGKAGMARQG